MLWGVLSPSIALNATPFMELLFALFKLNFFKNHSLELNEAKRYFMGVRKKIREIFTQMDWFSTILNFSLRWLKFLELPRHPGDV